ncbi:hypothetical protein [Streptomyces sp. NPDC092903]|uniref:hypothetical protein n=1 Tax=Streptomyces sp. NPDC092903 TaxID=3366017 RepID=UPI0037F38326
MRKLGRPRVCETSGLYGGVLLTRIVSGKPLADELASHPWETGDDLLDAVLVSLGGLHGPAGAACLRGAASIGERSVVGVFRRKFNGLSANSYLRTLGQGSGLPEHERQEIIELVQNAVWRLLRLSGAISSRKSTAVFGNLKPEHVDLDGRALLLALGHPDTRAGQQIVQGLPPSSSGTSRRYPSARDGGGGAGMGDAAQVGDEIPVQRPA